MASKTDICNMALSHLGHGDVITNITTDRSEKALALNLIYETTRDATLADYQWPFATKYATLALVSTDTTREFTYDYRLPADCLRPILIPIGGVRTLPEEIFDNRRVLEDIYVRYEIGADSSGTLIRTNEPDAELKYVFRHTNEAYYPPDFVILFSLRLAALVAPRLTGGDPFKMGTRAWQAYSIELSHARANAANQERTYNQPESDLVNIRK